MKHITTDKGDIGVAKVIADLIEKGFPVFTPISASCPFDLLIYKDTFKRVQVKYRTISNRGTLDIALRRSVISNTKIKHSKNQEVDIVAVYCPETNKCYYIDAIEVGSSISLRVGKTKNNQSNNIKFAEDYENI
jgi:hypothetical protein